MFYGRDTELAELDRLIEAAASGHSGSVVVRGEAGIGKSSLLTYAQDAARRRGFTVLTAAGWEAESGLAFGGLLQLLRPVLDRADALPQPQADALRTAVGAGEAREQDRFLTGLAVLSLLAEVAEHTSVVCLVDDAQWLDEPSADALLFAARRLAAEGVAVVFAARDDGFPAAGLRQLVLPRLGRADALLLLDELEVPPAVREQLVAESAGNPLALREFSTSSPRPASRPLPVAERVLGAYRSRIMALPERTRLMLLIAAAEARGILSYMLGAAEALGVGLDDLADAEQQGLVTATGDRIDFRHPLMRTAAYAVAPVARRVAVHAALADASGDPDCRASHRAAAATAPDEDVAAGMEGYANRALARGGIGAAANAYAQAARLSPGRAERVRRLMAAAWAAQQAGRADQAAQLAEEAEGGTEEPRDLAELAFIRSFWLFEQDRAGEAAALLLDHGPACPDFGAEMIRTAAQYAWLCGDDEAVHRAATLLDGYGDDSAADDAVRGLAQLAEGDFARGLPLIAGLMDDAPAGSPTRLQVISSGSLLPDDELLELVTEEIEFSRREGVIGRLPYLLHVLTRQQIYAGRHRDAEATAAEAAAIARDTGLRARITRLDNLVARIAAIEGDEERVRSLVSTGMTAGSSHGEVALSLLDLGLGRYEDALRRLAELRRGPGRHSAALVFAAADEVEAAVRLGAPERGEAAARRFAAWAEASGQPWARAVALRNEGLLGDAAQGFEDALKLHADADAADAAGGAGGAGGGRPFERARTELLFGEHLRRARRRAEARGQLRSALASFERLGAAPWAERARTELRATGETLVGARASAPALVDRLTPQELQVVRLAADGTSSREIAARLFLSPRTVEYHLYKAYPKLGVNSRRELVDLDLSS